jgi:hypothetical protein
VNLGGEPERDDFGLPPVDIEIPDDARELDRDVQAYRRELRAQRRRQRRMRLHGPLTRDGVVLPLLASCLVLALIAGTLLTVFTAGPGGELPRSGTAAHSGPATSGSPTARPPGAGPAPSPADSPTAGPSGLQLPAGEVRIDGHRASLQSLRRSVVALVPIACHCTALLQRLEQQARAAGVRYYLIGGGGVLAPVPQLAGQAPRRAIVNDSASVLAMAYMPVLTGPMALLIRPDGSVNEVNPLSAGFRLNNQLHSLATAQVARSASPAASKSAPAG